MPLEVENEHVCAEMGCVFGQMFRIKIFHVCSSNQKLNSSLSLMQIPEEQQCRRWESWTETALALRLKLAASHKGDHFQDSASGALLLFETCEGLALSSVLQHVGEERQQGKKTKQIPPLKQRAQRNDTLCLLHRSELLTHVEAALSVAIIDFLCVAGQHYH